MTWRDTARLAAASARHRLGRAGLTVAAVALAACLLTALLAIVGTARSRVLDELADGGPLAGIKVAAAEPRPGQEGEDDARPGAARDLDEQAAAAIAALDQVRAVLPVVAAPVLVLPPDAAREPFADTAVGVDLEHAGDLPVSVLAGRLPAARSPVEVAVTEGYLERLGLGRAEAATVLGGEVELGAARRFTLGGRPQVRGRWTRATIVGVVAQEAAPGQLLMSRQAVEAARDWARAGPPVDDRRASTSPYAGLYVVARGLDQVGPARAAIAAIGYSTSAPENLLASVDRYVTVVEIVLGAVGLIALAVAGLGVASALFATVRERRREIGVLKAVGARDRDIRRMVVLEAAALGLVGGVIGALAGWGAAAAVARVVDDYLRGEGLPGLALDAPAGLLAASTAGATVLAAAAGWLPARRAARLAPREAVAGG